MCDLDKVSWLLGLAKTAYLAALVLLGIGILNSLSLFGAAANVPLMIVVIASTGVSIGLYIAALAALDECATGPCGVELESIRNLLLGLLTTLSIYMVGLTSLAIVAALPIAGAAAIGTHISLFVASTGLISMWLEVYFSNAVLSFNDCRARAAASTIHEVVRTLSFAVGVAGLIVNGLALIFAIQAILALPAPVRR